MPVVDEKTGQSSDVAVWWIKRDMRLADNAALCRAMAHHASVLPLYVFEPTILAGEDCSAMHLYAQLQALQCLQVSLQQRGGTLWLAYGDMTEILQQLSEKTGFRFLYSHQETGSQLTYKRDLDVINWCQNRDVTWTEETQTGVIRGPHRRHDRPKILAERLLSQGPLEAPARINCWEGLLPENLSQQVPTLANLLQRIPGIHQHAPLQAAKLQSVTEKDAIEDLDNFLGHRGVGYAGGISSPNTAFTHGSRLSPHLAWGTLSLRTTFHRTNQRLAELASNKHPMEAGERAQWVRSLRAFQSRLFWHDHFIQRLESVPGTEFEAINPGYRSLHYPGDERSLHAWVNGQTGFPIVDASMRCLRGCGFLNFRMRAMLVSVACYGLGLSWKQIQFPLARVFLDYEPGIHFSQIQMQAGIVGINTIRVYSPLKQLLEQDPACQFVKQWVPELREFQAEEIACYETRSLGDYPPPVADLEKNNKVMKDQIFKIRNSEKGKEHAAEILAAHGSGSRPHRRRAVSRRAKRADNKQLSLDF